MSGHAQFQPLTVTHVYKVHVLHGWERLRVGKATGGKDFDRLLHTFQLVKSI